MEGSENTGNSTVQNGSPVNNGEGTNSIENIMGNMANGSPEAKPENGDNAKGNEGSQSTELPAWTSQLSEELRNNSDAMKQLSKFGKISDLAKSYSELESKLGKSIVKPGKDASDEEREAFYQALGKPKAADKYSLDGENTQAFKELAYKHNLTDEQAKGLYEAFTEIGNNAIAQQKAIMAANAKATDDLLREEWGNKYDAKITMLQRGVNTYGGKALGEKLKNSGLLFDADVIRMFVKLGEESAEAGSTGKTASGGKEYKTTAEGGTFSWIEKIK